ncbi:hypothetical protein LWI28_024397 [Acer negundo]|uniref:Reverse transcriptase/retrotransposon-derived protein RNase H-like domain-containing protein n=1 Tax=Acer negundo TaxID=4023 RepID=A0AAD5J114_ACENE|nr:hypothetical protein LWI28_024397 [Acer negundo]
MKALALMGKQHSLLVLYFKEFPYLDNEEELQYLGHIILGAGVKVDPRKIEGYHRRFVKNYGLIAKLLTAMLKKDSFEWTEEAKKAFEDLKWVMTQTFVLALLDFEKPFEVYTDASGEGIGVVLVWEKRHLAFVFKSLGPMKKD